MTEHHRRLTLPEDARIKGPSPQTIEAQRHASRVELVRAYLHNPKAWPEGIDWPNWKEPHEIWFTGSEAYWIPLAIAAQAKRDAEHDLKQSNVISSPSPRRRPLLPEKPTDSKAARLKATNAFLATADRILKEATERALKALSKEPAKEPAQKKQAATTANSAAAVDAVVAGSVAEKRTGKTGRPRTETRGKQPSAATLRKRRQREAEREARRKEVAIEKQDPS